MRELVVDTSVAAKLYLDDEALTSLARAVFEAHADRQLTLITPFVIYYELPSTILTAARRRRIDPQRAHAAVTAFTRLEIPVVGASIESIRSLTSDAYEVAARFGCSFYDAIFSTVAERLNTQLLTADEKLYGRLKDVSGHLLWLGDLDLP